MPLHSGSGRPPPPPPRQPYHPSPRQRKRDQLPAPPPMRLPATAVPALPPSPPLKRDARRRPPSPPPPPSKLDCDLAAMGSLQAHGDMFAPVADVLGWVDTVEPAGTHKDLFEEWTQKAEAALRRTVEDGEVALDPEAAIGLEAAKDVAIGALEKFLQRARAVGWSSQTVAERQEHVRALLARPQIPQRTPDWYAQGKRVLTASEFATLFKTPRAVSQMVLSKSATEEEAAAAAAAAAATPPRLACMTCEMGPFDWGIRFEPVVKQVLQERWGATIVEAGRLVHPKDPLLAASPDGLILEAADPARVGRLLEIKCPITRAVGEGVPFEYWCQMQIQMEVTDIDECEYVEVKIQSLQKHATDLSGGGPPDGTLWLFQEPAPSCQMIYAYTAAQKEEFEARGWDCVETIPWRVETFVRELVVRDRAWFAGTEAARAKFWADVASARAGTYTAPEPTRARVRAAAAAGPQQVIVHKEGAAATAATATPSPFAACMILDDETPTPPPDVPPSSESPAV